ncbi:MAG: OmpA family protein [Bacteroidota bacterium]
MTTTIDEDLSFRVEVESGDELEFFLGGREYAHGEPFMTHTVVDPPEDTYYDAGVLFIERSRVSKYAEPTALEVTSTSSKSKDIVEESTNDLLKSMLELKEASQALSADGEQLAELNAQDESQLNSIAANNNDSQADSGAMMENAENGTAHSSHDLDQDANDAMVDSSDEALNENTNAIEEEKASTNQDERADIQTFEKRTNQMNAMLEEQNINNILFGFDSFRLTDIAIANLEGLIEMLENDGELIVQIATHTDSRGSVQYNEWLSKKRAMAIQKYLVAQGISADRFVLTWHGELQLANTCSDDKECDESDHQLNRRAEFSFISEEMATAMKN